MHTGKGEAYSEILKKDSLHFFLLIGLGKTILKRFECVERLIGTAGAWFLQKQSRPQAESILVVDDDNKRRSI